MERLASRRLASNRRSNRRSKQKKRAGYVQILIFIFLVTVFCLTLTLTSMAKASRVIDYHNTTEIQTVVVEKGDSLWSLAKEYYPSERNDIRKVIHQIKKVNNLTTAEIYIGQTLFMPCQLDHVD